MSSGFEHSQTFSVVDKAYLGLILVIYETFTEYVFQNKFVQCDNELFYTCEELEKFVNPVSITDKHFFF